MKLRKTLLLLFIMLATIVVSCKKEETNSPELTEKSLVAENNSKLFLEPGVIKLENGLIAFKDEETFSLLGQSIVANEKETIEMFERFKRKNGFDSMSDLFERFNGEISNAASEVEYNNVIKKYSDIVRVNPDSTFSLKYDLYLLSNFLDKDGQLKIGDKVINWNDLVSNKTTARSRAVSVQNQSRSVRLSENDYREGSSRRLIVELYYEDYRGTALPPLLPPTSHTLYYRMQQYKKNLFGKWVSMKTVYHINNFTWSIVWDTWSGWENGGPTSITTAEQTTFVHYFIQNRTGAGLDNSFVTLSTSGHFSSRGVPNNGVTTSYYGGSGL